MNGPRVGRLLAVIILPIASAAHAAPAAAQEWQVARERFAFAGSRLEILVDVQSPGRLRLIRGAPGSVRVAGRAATGFTAAGLTDDERLTLSALSDGPVDYMVSVPEGVWVTVRLPDRPLGESMASYDRGRTYEWGRDRAGEPTAGAGRTGPSPDVTAPDPVPQWLPAAPDDGFDAPLVATFTRDAPPLEIDLPDLRYVRSVTVRIQGDRFRVAASRPLAVEDGDPARLEIRPAAPPMDLVLVLPAGTPAFDLRAEGTPALRIAGGEVSVFCSPVTRQWLSDGRRWVTFTPVEGALQCQTVPTLRHEG